MERKTPAGMMGLAQVMIGAAVTCLTGCEMLLDHKWAEFRARQDGAAGGMAAGSTGSMGAGGGGGSCQGIGGSAGPAPSCAGGGGGLNNCINDPDCCDSPTVLKGADDVCGTICEFNLDAYEVTVGRFKKFVNALDGYAIAQKPAGWMGTWEAPAALQDAVANCEGAVTPPSTWNLGNDNLPVNCVTWAEANAFCEWDGGRLPTMGELRRVSHGDDKRKFPWGNDAVDDFRASVDGSEITPVGTRFAGASFWEHHDLIGNVQEWTHFNNACMGSAFNSSTQPTFGGSHLTKKTSIEMSIPETSVPPGKRSEETGFRCARNL